jgi:hypothetical protein
MAVHATNPRPFHRDLAAVETQAASRSTPAMSPTRKRPRMARPTSGFHIGFHYAAEHFDARSKAKPLKLLRISSKARGISTPSLQAQGEQRRHFIFNKLRDIPRIATVLQLPSVLRRSTRSYDLG